MQESRWQLSGLDEMHIRSIAVSKRLKSLGRIGVMTRLRCGFVVFCTLLFILGAVAQVQNGQFTGTVTDPSGAAVPKASVTVTGPPLAI